MKRNDRWEKIKTRMARHGRNAVIKNVKDPRRRHRILTGRIIRWYFTHPGYIVLPELYFSNVELSVTTNCTLRCKNCCHYIPRYERTNYTPAETLIEDLRKLLDNVRYIDEFRLLGGEPLLHPELHRIAAYLLQSEKIGMVEIVTNGTLSPSKELLALFPNDRLNIEVSNYGKLSVKIKEFASNGVINATITPEDYYWQDHGSLIFKNRSEKELQEQYSRCSKDKCVLLDGKLFICACCAYGSDLKAFQLRKDEFVDFRSSDSREKLQKKLKQLKHRKYSAGCNYCNWGTDEFIRIRAAEQIGR